MNPVSNSTLFRDVFGSSLPESFPAQHKSEKSEAKVSEVALKSLGNPLEVRSSSIKTLDALLESHQGIYTAFSHLQKEINTLRNEAQMTVKRIDAGSTSDKSWQEDLEIMDAQYEAFAQLYGVLSPKINEAIRDFFESIAKVDQQTIPSEERTSFNKKREECVVMREKLQTLLSQADVRFDNARDHLNAIDNKIAYKRSTSLFKPITGTLVSYATKIRISPTEKSPPK